LIQYDFDSWSQMFFMEPFAKPRRCFFLSPLAPWNSKRNCQSSRSLYSTGRGTSGERIEERGISNKNAPPLPVPLNHQIEERGENSRATDSFAGSA
jgi:hypothetical protein